MKPYQEVLELAAEFEAQANQAAQSEERRAGDLAMLHRGERDAFAVCARRTNDLARHLAESDGFFASTEPAGGEAPPDAPPDGKDWPFEVGREVSRLWAFVREVDDRLTAALTNQQGHTAYHNFFPGKGKEGILSRLDKAEKRLESLAGANEMHAAVHSRIDDDTKDVRGFRDYLIASKFATQLDTIRARLEATEDHLRAGGHVGLFGGRQRRSRRA